MRKFHENPVFETVKLKMIISLFQTVRTLYNSLKSIKEKDITDIDLPQTFFYKYRYKCSNSVTVSANKTDDKVAY